MTSLNISFKKLQFHFVHAFVCGLMRQQPAKGYQIVFDETDREFILALVEHNQGGEYLLYHRINKGEYQMNDVRPGVIVNYLCQQVDEFLVKVHEYLSGLPSAN